MANNKAKISSKKIKKAVKSVASAPKKGGFFSKFIGGK